MTPDGLGNFISLSPNAAREIVSKLGAEKLIRILGPYLGGGIPATIAAASSIYTDYTVRASEAERREAYEIFSKELPRLVNLVRQKNVPVISGAFNSDLRYMNAFASAAFIGITLAVKKGIDAINRIGTALDAIKGELSIQTIGNVQGWGEGGLGSHIHRLVLMEIEKSHFEDGMHLFYVWTPGNTTWHARFTERNREQPLGSRFGGYHDDLGTICNLMWSNRKTLMETVPHGKDAIFHLLVPSFETIVIEDPIIFHDSLHPLVVKGDIYRGHPLVWLNPALARDRLVFQDIGVLPNINDKVMDNGRKAFLGCWVSGAACVVTMAAGATLFPPLLVYESYLASAFVSSCVAGMSSIVGTTGALAYNDLTAPTSRPIMNDGVNIRLEAVDAMEESQELTGATAARDKLLRRLGFTDVRFSGNPPFIINSGDQEISVHALSNGFDSFGTRLVGFIYEGDGSVHGSDGSVISLDRSLVDESVNTALLSEGYVFPAFYDTLPENLREHLAIKSTAARMAKKGVWLRSKGFPGDPLILETPTLANLRKAVLWPKLYRRLEKYLESGGPEHFDGFNRWLQEDCQSRDDGILLI